MICFRDMTFCGSDCTNTACYRHFGEDDRQAARKWWSHDPDRAPIAFGDLSKGCPEYQSPNVEIKED